MADVFGAVCIKLAVVCFRIEVINNIKMFLLFFSDFDSVTNRVLRSIRNAILP